MKPRFLVLIATAMLLSDISSLHAATAKYDVQQYVEKGQNYLGVEVTVEGRVALSDKTAMKFRNCDVRFRFNTPRVGLPQRTRTVEVTGQSKREVVNNKERTVFFVDSIRPLPDDLDTFQQREIAIPRTAGASAWYELADWAERRGKFYNDLELQARGETAYMRGIQLERRAVPADAPQKLLDLVKKLSGRNVASELQQSMTHDYCVRSLEAAARVAGPARLEQIEALRQEVERLLPGSTQATPVYSRREADAYISSRVRTYDAADAQTRLRLHRYLYIELQEALILSELAEDSSNGFDIAQRIDKQIPERHGLAEELRDKVLDKRASEVDKLNQPDLLALAADFRKRNDAASANTLIESWLMLKRKRLAADDLEGTLELAGQYRKLLNRDELADKILLDAAKTYPKATELAVALSERGYKFHEDEWVTEAQFNALPEAAHDRALREGRVIAGLTASQVRKAKGKPDSLARSASQGQVNEVWTYKLTDNSRLIVQFTRFQFRGGEPTVVAVVRANAETP